MFRFSLVDSPLGSLCLVEKEGAIVFLKFGIACPFPDALPSQTPLLQETVRQLDEYFSGCRQSFSLPLAPEGTAFQQRVWQQLLTIPYGETWSYGQLAARIGSPKACRAVGMANHRNPISILIPCHRVIGADGSLTGYGGGLDKKIFLLSLERDGLSKEKEDAVNSL